MNKKIKLYIFIIFLVTTGCINSPIVFSSNSKQLEIVESELVKIPAGFFLMGSGNGDLDEKPIHPVYLPAFYINKYEITNEQYQQCVDDLHCNPLSIVQTKRSKLYVYPDRFHESPINLVSWYDAKNFCEWAGGRLPTEAEWEKAAKGTSNRTYPWGNEIDCSKTNYGTYGEYCYGGILPVKHKTSDVSINNVHGLGGNLQEWVSDCYVEDFYSNFPQSSIDPSVDGSNCMRVIRGGAFMYGEDFSRTTKRNASDPNNNDIVVGFRCVFNK